MWLAATGWGTGDFREGFLNGLKTWQSQNKDFLADEDLGKIGEIATLLLEPYLGFQRQQKAGRLEKATGQRLTQLDLICDLRPVFDEERKTIEGWLPLTHLKVVATSESGLPVMFEAVMSEFQIRSLQKAADSAIRKLECLKSHAKSAGASLPTSELL